MSAPYMIVCEGEDDERFIKKVAEILKIPTRKFQFHHSTAVLSKRALRDSFKFMIKKMGSRAVVRFVRDRDFRMDLDSQIKAEEEQEQEEVLEHQEQEREEVQEHQEQVIEKSCTESEHKENEADVSRVSEAQEGEPEVGKGRHTTAGGSSSTKPQDEEVLFWDLPCIESYIFVDSCMKDIPGEKTLSFLLSPEHQPILRKAFINGFASQNKVYFGSLIVLYVCADFHLGEKLWSI